MNKNTKRIVKELLTSIPIFIIVIAPVVLRMQHISNDYGFVKPKEKTQFPL